MQPLNTFMITVVDHINTHIQQKVICELHPGSLIEKQLISLRNNKTPVIYLALTGVSKTTCVETDEKDVFLEVVAYSMSFDEQALIRETTAQDIVSILLTYIPKQRWGLDNVHPVTNIKAADFYGVMHGFTRDIDNWHWKTTK